MKTWQQVVVAVMAVTVWSAGAAEEPIRIGGLFDLSGKAQHIGTPSRDVAAMMVDRLNAQGGVKGRKIELVVADTLSEPSQAVVALKRLIEKDKVVAVIGPTTTGAAMACLKTVEDARIPMVACVGGDAPVEPTRPFMFKTPQRTTTAVARLFAYLQKQKITSIGLLPASDKFGQEGEAAVRKLAPEYGIAIAAREAFDPAADTDMTVQLTKVAAAKPQAVVVWTIGPAGAIIAKNAKQANLGLPLFQCHGQPDDNYIKLAGDAAEGTLMPATRLMAGDQLPANDPQRAAVLDFIKEYKARKLGAIGTHSGYAWDAVQLVFQAITKVGTESAALRAALEGTHGYVGVSGIYNLSPTDHCGLDVSSLVMVKVEKGAWKLVE